LLNQEYEEWKIVDREVWNELEKERINQVIAEREQALKHKERLSRMIEDAERFQDDVQKIRHEIYVARLSDWQKRLDEEREGKLLQRKQERKLERRRQWILEKQRQEARRLAEEARKRKEEEYAEAKRLSELQQKRERESEQRMEEERQKRMEEMQRMEEERQKAHQAPESSNWRANQPQSNQPPQRVFNENPRINRGPPVNVAQAADRDWGALRTEDRPPVRVNSDQPSQPRIIRNLDNDNRINKPPIKRGVEERDFGDLRKDREVRPPRPVRDEKDFGNLRRDRPSDDQQQPLPPSHADRTDDWRSESARKKDENKDPRSTNLGPPRKIPQQRNNDDRDFGSLRRDRDNMPPNRGGDRSINQRGGGQRDSNEYWRRGGEENNNKRDERNTEEGWRTIQNRK